MDAILFDVLAVVALLAAGVVVGQKNPMYSAFSLIAVLGCLAGIYGLLGSPFIAALQVIVYAGAIMVLFLFVLMLLNVRSEEPHGKGHVLQGAALGLVVLLVLQVGVVLLGVDRGTGVAGFYASTGTMASLLFSRYFVYTFEATGVLIAAALVGAVVLSRKEP